MTYTDTDVFLPRMTPQQIADSYARRRLAKGPDIARMQEVQMMVNGDIVVSLAEMNRSARAAIPNRAREGLKQFAQRIASAIPTLKCPPTRPGFDNSQERADLRRRAILGWWGFSRQHLILRQRARYLQGYAESPVEICWDQKLGVPRYEPVNPLFAYPAHTRNVADMCPTDCILELFQPLRWIQQRYPLAAAQVYKGGLDKADPDKLYTILKYVDAHETQMVVLGQKQVGYQPPPPNSMVVWMDGYPNRAGRCPIVWPKQICLDRLQGQFDGISGPYQTEALLMELSIQATRRGVFADPWLVSHPGEEAEVVEIPTHTDEGTRPGVVKGGTLTWEGVNPQFQTNMAMDRLAASQNETAGVSSELQGVSPTNVRTGARAQLLLSNVIDFPIQEAQELLQESLQEENKVAIAYAKQYSGPKSFYVNWGGARGNVTYDPQTVFDTDENIVEYPLAGSDQAGLTITGGQLLGMKALSTRSFMELHPLVKDVDLENDRIVYEQLQQAAMMALEQQVAQGQMDLAHVERIAELVLQDKYEFFQAVARTRKEAQEQQAQQAPPGGPETQPGLGAPPQPQGAAPPDAAGLAAMLSSLRRPQTGVTPQEVNA